MGVTIFKTKDVEVRFRREGSEVRSDVNIVDVEHSRVAEFGRPENQARLFLPERWPALYAKLEISGMTSIVPNIYVAHPVPNSRIFNFMMGDVALTIERPELSAKQVYFKSELAIRAVDGKGFELALKAKVHGAGKHIGDAYPYGFLPTHTISFDNKMAFQILKDLADRTLQLTLWRGKDAKGPRLSLTDRTLDTIFEITLQIPAPTVLIDLNDEILGNDAILVSSVIDEHAEIVSGVLFAYEQDGKVLREFFGNQKGHRALSKTK